MNQKITERNFTEFGWIKQTLIGSTKTKEEVKMYSYIYQKNSPFKGYQIFSKRILKCCVSVKKA
jgi:hypothetical protein